MPFSSKTVFISGASVGLGLEFVKQILKSESLELLIASCRNPDSAGELQCLAKSNPLLKIVKLDVENDEDLESAYQEVKIAVGERGLNLLINNAAVYDRSDGGGIYVQTREKMQKHFNVNVTSPIMVVQKFLPLLRQAASQDNKDLLSCNKAGVVMLSSKVGSQTIAYNDTPDASLSLHYKEVRPDGILVFALHPGWVKTRMGTDRAPLVPHESIEKCLSVIADADNIIHGKLVDLNGEVLPF